MKSCADECNDVQCNKVTVPVCGAGRGDVRLGAGHCVIGDRPDVGVPLPLPPPLRRPPPAADPWPLAGLPRASSSASSRHVLPGHVLSW